MKDSIIVKDDFCPEAAAVRASALESGFGTWRPNKGEVGSSIYEGMSFWGRHSLMLRALSRALGGRPIFPNNMFFRVTRPETEGAYVHSDRHWGSWTCIGYLSEHKEVSGTGFYRHRESGLLEMPSFEEMRQVRDPGTKVSDYEQLKRDMVSGSVLEWEQLDFVRGIFNRALIFHAPLFHARCPRHGLGTDDATGRMVWVCHFEI